MSILAIKRFYQELDTLKHRSGSGNESSIRLRFLSPEVTA